MNFLICSFSSNNKLAVAQLDDAKKKKKVAFDLNVETYELPAEVVFGDYPNRGEENDGTAEEDETQKEGNLHSENSTLSAKGVLSDPLNNRYQCCASCDYQCEDTETEETGEEGDGSDQNERVIEQESSESLFSLSIDSKKYACAAEAEEKEVNSPMPMNGLEEKECRSVDLDPNLRRRSHDAQSVLNPVENIFQWEKGVKARAISPMKNQEKENLKIEQEFAFSVPFSPKPAPSLLNRISRRPNSKETAVDTSFSSWLSASESASKSKTGIHSVGNSPSKRLNTLGSAEDRPILGMLSVEDLRPPSASNSPRLSRCRSPDDMPIIGTVGSYWSCTGQAEAPNSCSSCRGKLGIIGADAYNFGKV